MPKVGVESIDAPENLVQAPLQKHAPHICDCKTFLHAIKMHRVINDAWQKANCYQLIVQDIPARHKDAPCNQ